MREPTYYEWKELCGLAQIGELETKRIHRNWWDEYYPEIDYGGESLKDYGDEICDFVTEMCAEQIGVRSEHKRLLEEDDTWYDYEDPASYVWDESLGPNSTGHSDVDDYADDLTGSLIEAFAIEGAPEFTREALDSYVKTEEMEECPPGCPYCEEVAEEGKR